MVRPPTKWKGRMQFLSFGISSLAVLISAVSIFLTVQIFKHEEKKDSAELALRFTDYFDKPKFVAIAYALDTDNVDAKIFKDNGGAFTEAQIDDYIVLYETLDILYKENLINHEITEEEFSYDLEKAYNNTEIQRHIKEEEKSDSTLWSGFIHLAKEFK